MRVFCLVGTLLVFVVDLPACFLSDVTDDAFPEETTAASFAGVNSSHLAGAGLDDAVCSLCRMNEVIKREVSAEQLEKYRLEKAKMEILGQLGFKSPPEFPGEHQDEASRKLIIDSLLRKDLRSSANDDSAPGGSLALDEEELLGEEAADEPEIVETETVVFGSAGPYYDGQQLIDFEFSKDGEVISAELWLHLKFRSPFIKEFRRSKKNFRPTIFIFQLKANVTPEIDATKEEWKLLGTLGVTLKKLGWQVIDLSSALADWFSNSTLVDSVNCKTTLLIDCANCRGLIEVGTPPPAEAIDTTDERIAKQWLKRRNYLKLANEAVYTPYFVVSVRQTAKKRKRRSSYCPVDGDARVKLCCKRRLYVSFRQLGWDEWILYPTGYFANYCFGDCQELNFAHFNTHVLQDYRTIFGADYGEVLDALAPCCSPTKLSPVSLIYYDQNRRIIKRDLPRMRVEECGCA